MFDGPAALIAALATLVGALAGAYGVWVKWGHLWRGGTVNILEAHATRMQEQLDAKQMVIDEITEAVVGCEVHEAEMYGWMQRQNDRVNWMADRLRARGEEPGEPLEVPPRRQRAKLGKAMAAYLRNRSKWNTELAKAVTDELLRRKSEMDDDGEAEETKTY